MAREGTSPSRYENGGCQPLVTIQINKLAEMHMPVYKFLLNKWYFDEIYDFFLVRPAMWIGHFLWKKGDGWTIDGFGPDGVSARVIDVTNRIVRLQSGYVYHYAFAMLIGVAALVTWFMFGGAH